MDIRLELQGKWWTEEIDFVRDVNELGFEVDDINEEYVVLMESGNEDDDFIILYFGRANRTFWVKS